MAGDAVENGVSWRIVAGAFGTVLLLLGGAVAGNLHGRQNETEKTVNEQKADVAVIKEQMKQIQRDTQETRETVKDTNRKVDELKDLIRGKR